MGTVSEIKDFSDAQIFGRVHEFGVHAPGQISVHISLYADINCSKKACISGCMGLKIHAPEGQIMHFGCRVHPSFRTLGTYINIKVVSFIELGI